MLLFDFNCFYTVYYSQLCELQRINILTDTNRSYLSDSIRVYLYYWPILAAAMWVLAYISFNISLARVSSIRRSSKKTIRLFLRVENNLCKSTVFSHHYYLLTWYIYTFSFLYILLYIFFFLYYIIVK